MIAYVIDSKTHINSIFLDTIVIHHKMNNSIIASCPVNAIAAFSSCTYLSSALSPFIFAIIKFEKKAKNPIYVRSATLPDEKYLR